MGLPRLPAPSTLLRDAHNPLLPPRCNWPHPPPRCPPAPFHHQQCGQDGMPQAAGALLRRRHNSHVFNESGEHGRRTYGRTATCQQSGPVTAVARLVLMGAPPAQTDVPPAQTDVPPAQTDVSQASADQKFTTYAYTPAPTDVPPAPTDVSPALPDVSPALPNVPPTLPNVPPALPNVSPALPNVFLTTYAYIPAPAEASHPRSPRAAPGACPSAFLPRVDRIPQCQPPARAGPCPSPAPV